MHMRILTKLREADNTGGVCHQRQRVVPTRLFEHFTVATVKFTVSYKIQYCPLEGEA